jgi:hypothetical protein
MTTGARETERRPRKTGPLYVPRELISSPAFLTLTGRAPQVLLIFFGKRRIEKLKRPGPHGERFRVTNNGELVFSYRQARKTYGLSMRIFGRALDQLIAHGFIDVDKTGGGMQGDCSLYALSERWRTFGTADFVLRERVKGRRWEIETAHKNVRAPAHKNACACPDTAHTNVRGSPSKPAPKRAQKCIPSIDYHAPGAVVVSAAASSKHSSKT